MIDKHEPGEVWLQPISQILKHWRSIDIRMATQPPYNVRWERWLKARREDDHYPLILESLLKRGWVRPLTCYNEQHPGGMYTYFGDGHHRLAAAIELRAKVVPMIKRANYSTLVISNDSGDWGCYGTQSVNHFRNPKFKELDIPPFKVKTP